MPASVPQPSLWTGLLLAGGASRRMGRDKTLLMLEGEPLWQRQWRTLREAGVGSVMIARGAQPWVEVPGLERVEDAAPGCGPLGGLVGALRRVETKWLVVLGIDLPRMPSAYLRGLAQQAEKEARGVVPMIGGRYEPLAAVYPHACLGIAEEALASGDRSLQALVRRCVEAELVRGEVLSEDERGYFQNVNTPEELAAVSRSEGVPPS